MFYAIGNVIGDHFAGKFTARVRARVRVRVRVRVAPPRGGGCFHGPNFATITEQDAAANAAVGQMCTVGSASSSNGHVYTGTHAAWKKIS